jgi:hypothetical protein
MRVDPSEHLARPLLVHELAPDFDLLDVWRLPANAERENDGFDRLVRCFPVLRGGKASSGGGSMRFLLAVRAVLLRMFGKQADGRTDWPIPGCSEKSLRERMSPEDRARFAMPSSTSDASAMTGSMFSPVYATPTERVWETSNATVHALLHLSWVAEGGGYQGYLSMYSKPRGAFGKFYMALISPFRHLLVYPSMMKSVARAWQKQSERDARAPSESVLV